MPNPAATRWYLNTIKWSIDVAEDKKTFTLLKRETTPALWFNVRQQSTQN